MARFNDLAQTNKIRPKNAGPDGQLHRSWQPSAASARSFVKSLNLHIHSAGEIKHRPEFVYRAVRKSYIINPTLARPRAGREGEGRPMTIGMKGLALQQYHDSTPSNSISQGVE